MAEERVPGGRPDEEAPAPPRNSRGLRRIPMLRALISGGLLAFTLGVVFGNVLPTRATLDATEQALEEQQRHNTQIETRLVELAGEQQRLATDPWTVERILRDELHYAPEGDVRIR